MKIIRPEDFKKRSEKGDLYLRVDFNVVNLSTQLTIDMNLKAGDSLVFAEDMEDVIIFKPNADLAKAGFKLRRLCDKTLCFSMSSFSKWLFNRYGLTDIMKNSEVFKHHKFPLELTKEDGIYRLVPPQKYVAPEKKEKASSNGVLQKT
jgi:hypothetical protein